MKAFIAQGEGRGAPSREEIPDELQEQAQEYREKLMDEVAENSDELMERYLEGEEIAHDEIVTVLKQGVTEGTIFPVTCGVATKNLGTTRLLEALVEDLPSPAMRGAIKALDAEGEEIEIEPDEDGRAGRLRLQDARRPLRRPAQPLPRLLRSAEVRLAGLQRRPAAPRSGSASCSVPHGKEHEQVDELGAGDIGAVAKLKETRAGDVLADKDAQGLASRRSTCRRR